MQLWDTIWRGSQKDANTSDKVSPRILNFFDATALGIGSCLAIGISVLIGELIKNVRGPGVLFSIALAGVTALFAGLCFAEFGVRFLKGNSAYVFCYSGINENTAFIFGWALILQYVAGAASVARGIITFLDVLLDSKISNFVEKVTWSNSEGIFPYFDFFSLAVIIVVFVIILFVSKDSTTIRNIFSVCNIISVISFIITCSFKADRKNWEVESLEEKTQNGGEITLIQVLDITKGAAVAFYGYIGFDVIGITGNDIKKRQKTLPCATLTTILFTMLAFGGIGAVLTLMLPSQLHSKNAALPFAFEKIGWTGVKWVAAVAAFFGFLTSLFGAAFPLHTIIYTMANDGLLFHWLGNKHPKLRAPLVTMVIGGVITSLAAASFPFQKLAIVAVIATLFVYTVIAANVVLLRYSPTSERVEQLTDHSTGSFSQNASITFKTLFQSCFNFKAKTPTNLTEKIVQGNIILFCLSSIGLGVIFRCFSDSLMKLSLEAVIPGGILLCVMLVNLVSIICQPKYNRILPFEVPLVPLTPCISIFLNIFLMLTLESFAWVLFSIWMAVGIIPHLVWYTLKSYRSQIGKNSLYEINKTNAVKLNDSIWKINSEKRSFYEGAVNPVFSYDLFEDIHGIPCQEEKAHVVENPGLQLKKAAIIHTAEIVEKIEPLDNALEMEYMRVNYNEINKSQPSEEGKIFMECVAEIHTENEYPRESLILEIVDNTYNFLGEHEETLKGEISEENSIDFKINQESETSGESNTNALHSEENLSEVKQISTNQEDTKPLSQTPEEAPSSNATKRANQEDNSVVSSDKNNINQGYDDQYTNLIMQTLYEAQKKDKLKADRGNSGGKETKSEEQNKTKVFKEKLNELLKNQMAQSTLTKNLLFSKITREMENEGDPVVEEEEKEKVSIGSVRTMNKSQVKNKLELLLSKGRSTRPSLSASFNIKIKQDEPEKKQVVAKNNNTLSNGKASSEVTPSLQDILREKKLALRSVSTEFLNDSRR